MESSQSRASDTCDPEEGGKFTNFCQAVRGAAAIFFELLGKRSFGQLAALFDFAAWWGLRRVHKKEYKELCERCPADSIPARDLKYAYDFASAIYGWMMQEGLMNDASHLMYGQATSAGFAFHEDEFVNRQAFLQMLKLPEECLIKCHMAGETLKPAYACVFDHEHARIVLCIRGSLSIHDAFTNTVAAAAQYSDADQSQVGTCHEGILRASLWLIEQVSSAMMQVAQDCRYSHYELVVTGHSLGAGVASLTTLMLQKAEGARPRAFGFRSVRGFGFATPGVVSAQIANSDVATGCFTSICNRRDMIVRLCLAKADRMCFEVTKYCRTTHCMEKLKDYAGLFRKTASHCDSELHYPLGRCLFLAGRGHDREEESCGCVLVRPVDATEFGKIFVHESMLTDHLLYQYGQSLGFER